MNSGARVNANAGNRANTGNRVNSGNRVNTGDRVNTGNVNAGNRVNTGNVNVNRVDINIDVDHGWDGDRHYHPIAAGVVIGATAAVTAAAIGSMYYTLPPSCSPYPYSGHSYYYCGGAYYSPRYQGDTVTYVVVEKPG